MRKRQTWSKLTPDAPTLSGLVGVLSSLSIEKPLGLHDFPIIREALPALKRPGTRIHHSKAKFLLHPFPLTQATSIADASKQRGQVVPPLAETSHPHVQRRKLLCLQLPIYCLNLVQQLCHLLLALCFSCVPTSGCLHFSRPFPFAHPCAHHPTLFALTPLFLLPICLPKPSLHQLLGATGPYRIVLAAILDQRLGLSTQ